MTLESTVLGRIKPTAEEIESITQTADELKKKVEDYIKENGINAEVRFVGSYAKGTYLSDPDIDLFLLFPETTPPGDLKTVGSSVGKFVLGETVEMYSDHPYTCGKYNGVDVDLVPSYAISTTDKLRTAVDRTPFHTDFILKNLKEAQKDEVRLLKKFMKGIGVYGAEPNTRGFSGYLCELLVLHYGSFRNVLEGASNWKDGTIIAIDNKRGPPIIGSLVVYDPVDPKRNVASAVHIDTMALFIVASKSYLYYPSEKFFFPVDRKPLSREELQKISNRNGSRIVTVVFDRPDIIEENLYSQLWKTRYALTRKLNDFDYNVLKAVQDMYEKKLEIVFELERDEVSKTYKHTGPPVWVKAADSFLSKWKNNVYGQPFVEDGCWNVIAERMYFTAKEMLADEAAVSGIGREIDPNNMKIRDHETSLNETNPALLTELLDPKQSWEV
ncbi:CCA-adding enzyme [Candidatus Methanoplasma termitum]|uniref:CCA-adding enzyme n=1 Tax=Candidatus Methanoplasma termitum TaxID=1577791 RepID=A0A0A7LF63_9ARCH|nr:CCA tRNA nucleotidyltransferase [Candidatus Methanoplasma termitum]AIZ56957.1 CCA-adding enzyme [Candidatus Methanoplasma termitum]MCL2333271.1 CCA tRNA nucleotidyltransferase [Candidatus Methanoplasma sp.]